VLNAIDDIEEHLRDALNNNSPNPLDEARKTYKVIEENLKNIRREIRRVRNLTKGDKEKWDYLNKLYEYAQEEEVFAHDEILNILPSGVSTGWDVKVKKVQTALKDLKVRGGQIYKSISNFLENDVIDLKLGKGPPPSPYGGP
ncbi:MAG: hypothetical protein Q8R37_01875, partial [Nanoarchaeota archaeon]|nr:hypothetical protein [Nanoarchaeota archaeon]